MKVCAVREPPASDRSRQTGGGREAQRREEEEEEEEEARHLMMATLTRVNCCSALLIKDSQMILAPGHSAERDE